MGILRDMRFVGEISVGEEQVVLTVLSEDSDWLMDALAREGIMFTDIAVTDHGFDASMVSVVERLVDLDGDVGPDTGL